MIPYFPALLASKPCGFTPGFQATMVPSSVAKRKAGEAVAAVPSLAKPLIWKPPFAPPSMLKTVPVGVPAGSSGFAGPGMMTTSDCGAHRGIVQGGQAGIVVGNPEGARAACGDAPGIDQVRIEVLCHTGQVRDKIGLQHIGGRHRAIFQGLQAWFERACADARRRLVRRIGGLRGSVAIWNTVWPSRIDAIPRSLHTYCPLGTRRMNSRPLFRSDRAPRVGASATVTAPRN